MSEGAIPISKAIPIIVVTWILSLVTTLALVYVAPSIFPTAVTTEMIEDRAIITTKLADGTVTSAKILDGTIVAQDIADGSIVTVEVADGAITTAKIAGGSITSAKIADSAIVTVKLANDSVTSEKIADGNVTTADLADSAVTTAKILDNAIVTVKLADGSVTSAKILDGTITATDLATNAVTTIKIADGAVTTSKIANNAVTSVKLAAGAIPFNATHNTVTFSTPSQAWVPDPGMSVNINLTRPSHLLIMFSSEAWLSAPGDFLLVRAMVGPTQAFPAALVVLTTDNIGPTNAASYSFNFYLPSVATGTYTIQIELRVFTGPGSLSVGDRTLIVIALPA